jgi:hypothetical protein
LKRELDQMIHFQSWDALPSAVDPAHEDAWQKVASSRELRDLAAAGYTLYQSFFPPEQPLRKLLDSMVLAQRLNVTWLQVTPGWIPNVPWGLMCTTPPPPAGQPIDPLVFFAHRYRLEYFAYPLRGASKALGSVGKSRRAHLVYWGHEPADTTGTEAHWQRKSTADPADVFVPCEDASDRKAALLEELARPTSPTAVLYLYCQATVGKGNAPALRFGPTAQLHDRIEQGELPHDILAEKPIVFANACSTTGADAYLANDLEAQFFLRGCRAYVGTETRVPIRLASRVAAIFFHYFCRRGDPAPMAAGEAMALTRRFLWMRYRNIGGFFYAYVNQYDLYMADPSELRALVA